MAFDVSRGLAAMGGAVDKMAGDTMLDLQRAELQKQAAILANDLATERESKGRAEAHGYAMETLGKQQEFQAGENKADRENRLATTNISAGASIAVANTQRQTQLDLQRMKESADPAEVKLAKSLENLSPEQWAALGRFQEIQRDRKAAPEHTFGWEPDPAKPGAMRPVKGGPRDPAYLGEIEDGKRRADKLPAGYRLAPDGVSLEFIPGGPADPSIAKRATPMNNEQARDAGFADRMQQSQSVLSKLDEQGGSAWGRMLENIGKGGNYLQTDEYQQFKQAKEDFINAQLRRESGAAISADEFTKADRQYFPQPGDRPEVIKQKAKTRQLAVDAMIRGAGPSYKTGPNVNSDEPPAPTAQPGTYKGPDGKPVKWADIEKTAKNRGISVDDVISRLGLMPLGAK